MSMQVVGQESTGMGTINDLVGESAIMIDLKRNSLTISQLDAPLLIQGDSGTGRESLARYVHEHSARSAFPFIPVDCSSLSETEFESELFGYSKDAFAGATRDSLGFIRAADGGTVFLDEIGQLTPSLQARVVKVLKEGSVVSVGDSRPHAVHVRVVAASNRDLRALANEGKFSPELLELLSKFTLKTPPLIDRQRDIVPLAQHFLNVQAELYREPLKRISESVAQVLQAYAWPGNVRELANVMEQAHVLASRDTIELSDIPLRLQNSGPTSAEPAPTLSLEQLEKQTILTALKRSNYNRAEASRLLGINIQRLKRRMNRLGLQG